MYEIFADLVAKKGVRVADVAKATGIRTGVFSDWKMGRYTPKQDKLKLIAEYFGVSVDYLLGVQSSGQGGYYTDPETAEAAQEMFENTELRALFDVARDMSADDLKAIYSIAIALKRKEQGYD